MTRKQSLLVVTLCALLLGAGIYVWWKKYETPNSSVASATPGGLAADGAASAKKTKRAKISPDPAPTDLPPIDTQPGAVVAFNKLNTAALTAAFKSNDDATIDGVLPAARTWFADDHVPAEAWHDWIPALFAKRRFADAADLSLRALVARPEPRAYHYLLPHRVESLIEIHKPEEALQAAKSYYNISDSKHLPYAIQYVALALMRAHPADSQIAPRFRAEQSSPAPSAGESILHTITIDPAPYEAALAHWKERAAAGAIADGLDYANLLLIADQTAAGEAQFRKMLPLCKKKADITLANEGIAAALRAQDQNPRRGNEYLSSVGIAITPVAGLPSNGANTAAPTSAPVDLP